MTLHNQTWMFRRGAYRLAFPLGHPGLLLNQLGLMEVNDEYAIQFRVPQGVWTPNVAVTDTKFADLGM